MEPSKLTEDQQKDVSTRMDSFRGDYLSLVEKYQIDFVSFPQYVQTQSGSFTTVAGMSMVDKKYVPVASPILKE